MQRLPRRTKSSHKGAKDKFLKELVSSTKCQELVSRSSKNSQLPRIILETIWYPKKSWNHLSGTTATEKPATRHLSRWGIQVEDSKGSTLGILHGKMMSVIIHVKHLRFQDGCVKICDSWFSWWWLVQASWDRQAVPVDVRGMVNPSPEMDPWSSCQPLFLVTQLVSRY